MIFQAVCDSSRCFTHVVALWPASMHDNSIFANSVLRDEFERRKYDDVLLGDARYALRKSLLVPLSAPKTSSEKRYSRSHIRIRVHIKQAFGLLKQRFLVIRKALLNKLDNFFVIIAAVLSLDNYAMHTGQKAVKSSYTEESPLPQSLACSITSGTAVREEAIRVHFSEEPYTGMY